MSLSIPTLSIEIDEPSDDKFNKDYSNTQIKKYFQQYFFKVYKDLKASTIVNQEKLEEIINVFLDKFEYTFSEDILLELNSNITKQKIRTDTTVIPVHKLSSEILYNTPSTDSLLTDSPSTNSPSTDSPSTNSPSTDSPSTISTSTDSHLTILPSTDYDSSTSRAIFTSINSYSDKKTFFAKEYNFQSTSNAIYISCMEHILHEVIMQYLYFSISKITDPKVSTLFEIVIIPALYKIKLTQNLDAQNLDMFTVTIFMQYIDEKSKIEYTHVDIERKQLHLAYMIRVITETFTIFETYGIYHLDSSHRNVFFIKDRTRTKLVIIDFGTSIVKGEQRLPTRDSFPKKLITKDQDVQKNIFSLWENPEKKAEYLASTLLEEVFGGYKKRKTRKTTKRKRSQKKKRHIKPTAARSLFSRKKA